MKRYCAWLKRALFSVSMMPFMFVSAYAVDTQNNAFSAMTGPLEQIMNVISGPIAQMAGVICIVIAGLGIAFGEGGSGVRRLFQVVMGLAIAFTAASLISGLFHRGSGLVF
ncbi:TrbC/VirB2 family protein [Fangia hongkongensis]|uniref:TrbC/VirB2 family protein n=1 Tax=Fangia hongkongensis TaxID=270495 RepID=UPI00036ED81D|nr:TrbC/VirB2 family protein [Fangia hongkongensis]MBK2126113.1 TrbC/VirB2 family protein [Fangia hongkongensis]